VKTPVRPAPIAIDKDATDTPALLGAMVVVTAFALLTTLI